jgi:hypothetical protein
MNWLQTMLVLLVAFLAVFAQAEFNTLREWLRTQISLLPPLMVYAAISTNLTTVSLLAVAGGLWTDALSANRLGVSVLPLFSIGLVLHRWREVLLRELTYAQVALGLLASAAAPLLTLFLLMSTGEHPLIGWGSLWQWLVMSVCGALATPPCFWLLDRLRRWFAYPPEASSAFRPDREIKRGRF